MQFSPHRVEVAVLFSSRTIDRAENYWTVLYSLSPLEQSCAVSRLGPAAVFNPKHASHHWFLDLGNPGQEEVARKLVSMAVGGGELPNFWNIRLKGKGMEGGKESSHCLYFYLCPLAAFDWLRNNTGGAI